MERLSDEKLLVRIGRGDESAFAVLFGRYVADVADFAEGITRDRDAAAEVVARAFARVWDRLQTGVRADFAKAWLYATARDEALTPGYRRALDAYEPDLLARTVARRSSVAQATPEDEDLVRLVCAAAERLTPRDYSLLDLHLRRSLSAKELATALSLERAAVSVLLSRLQTGLESSVSVSLLVEHGRGACEALASILTSTESSPQSDTRSAIRRHLRRCATCQQFTGQFAAPAAIFAGLRTSIPSEQLVTTVWASVSQHVADARRAGAQADSGRRRRRVVLTGAAAATVAAVSAVTVLAATREGDPARSRPITGTATAAAPSAKAAFLPPLQPARSPKRSRAVEPEIGTALSVSPAEREFGWVAVDGAVAYRLALYRGDALVFTARTREQRLTLPSTWLYNGHPDQLSKGIYRWYVWPVMSGASSPARKANVSARLVVG